MRAGHAGSGSEGGDMARSTTILITGAGSGLGRGLALALGCEAGGVSRAAGRTHRHILATDCRPETAQETASTVRARGGSAAAYRLDVTSQEDVRAFLAGIGDHPVDVLINNAGVQHVAGLEEFAQEDWDRVVDVILRGTCLMTRAVLPRMRANGFGRIVNIGSIHSLVASPYKSAYVAAKHALLGFAKVVALETADVDITINTICPAYIRTPLVDGQIAAQAQAGDMSEEEVIGKIMLQPMPKGRFITIEEVAAAVEFLMSDLARNITGQTVTIDGGWTAR
mgnify:CR=1 FL=1